MEGAEERQTLVMNKLTMNGTGNLSPSAVQAPSSTEADSEVLVLKRRLYTQEGLELSYPDNNKPPTVRDWIRTHCRCSARCVATQALSYVPIVGTLRRYNWRQWVLADVLAGLSVGFIHLPQGLGYGILASLTPAVGLYTSFFPILIYLIFGTSPHVSMGTSAPIALLTGSLVDREVQVLLQSNPASNLTEAEILEYKIGISTATCFAGGIILVAMGLLKLGFITNFLSKSFIGGFTFGAAVHIVTSQIIKILHVKIPRHAGLGKLILIYLDLFENIADVHVADMIVGLICMAVLFAVKIGINERFKDKLKMPVPIELIVVILSTIISHFAQLPDKYGVAVVGDVPTGMPAPALPPLSLLPRVVSDAVVIAILSLALSLSLGKMCAKLHGTTMDDNQELLAYGLCHLVGAFTSNFPACVAPPRTMLLSSLGSRSTLNGVTSAVFILLVLLVAGQLFVSLPIPMLAAMIIVAMKDLLLNVRQLHSLWHVNKPDFFIWLLTAVASIFGDLDLGLLVGVVFSMVTVLAVSQLAKGRLLGRAESEDVVMDSRCEGIKRVPGVRIFRFESSLYYASAERFKSQLYSLVKDPSPPSRETVVVNGLDGSSQPDTRDTNSVDKAANESLALRTDDNTSDSVHHVILDCSSLTYIDVAGIDTLSLVIGQFSRVGVRVVLATVPTATLATLHRSNFFETHDKGCVFYTVFDALQSLASATNSTSV